MRKPGIRQRIAKFFKRGKRQARMDRIELERKGNALEPESEDGFQHMGARLDESLSGRMHKAFASPEARKRLEERKKRER